MVREIDQAAVARWLRPVPPSALIPVASSIPAEKLNDSERHALRRELGLTPEAPVLVFFGDVRPDKGVLDLLEASAAIRRRGLDARLLMLSSVGSTAQTLSGYERRALERIAVGQREGWLTLVRSPAAHRVAHLMNASDVAVFPFTLGASENRTSLLSAIVNRLPVLTTRGPSTPAGFESRYGVTTVPARDTAALATAAEILLRQPEQRETLRQKAACAAQRFTWDAIADQTIALYRKCLL
jgi:glycosyltransferase involved in cell wall biosynthesis